MKKPLHGDDFYVDPATMHRQSVLPIKTEERKLIFYLCYK